MQPPFKPFSQPGITFRRIAVALLIATALGLLFGGPAQASFWQNVRGIFTGDTGSGARGNTRGAAIRDRRCGAAVTIPSLGEGEGVTRPPDAPTGNTASLILLALNTDQTLDNTTAPTLFVYIPPSTPSSAGPFFLSSPQPITPLNQAKIDLDNIDSVVDEAIKAKVQQAQQPELLLEFQFNDTTRYYSLPDEAVIAKLQAPLGTAFDSGEISSLEVRLVCRRLDLTSLSQTAVLEASYSTESEVFVNVQRVEPRDQLIAARARYAPDEVYQAYLENGLWFEMVAALAANPQSEEWAALLQELEIPAVDPAPQTLTPVTE